MKKALFCMMAVLAIAVWAWCPAGWAETKTVVMYHYEGMAYWVPGIPEGDVKLLETDELPADALERGMIEASVRKVNEEIIDLVEDTLEEMLSVHKKLREKTLERGGNAYIVKYPQTAYGSGTGDDVEVSIESGPGRVSVSVSAKSVSSQVQPIQEEDLHDPFLAFIIAIGISVLALLFYLIRRGWKRPKA